MDGAGQDPPLPPCVVVMDADCALCARGARWIARNDRAGEFGIAPMQTPLGAALMARHGLDARDPESWLYLEQGRAFEGIDAVIRVGRRLGGVWRLLGVLRALPGPVQRAVYGVVARNRRRWFGQGDMCALPDPALRVRLIEQGARRPLGLAASPPRDI